MLIVCPEYKKLIHSLVGDVPANKNITETHNFERFYKIERSNNTLFIPHLKYIRQHLCELDTLAESVTAFVKTTEPEVNYDWTNLCTKHYDTEADILQLITTLNSGATVLAADIETKDVTFYGNKLLAIGFAWSEADAASFNLFTEKIFIALQELFDNQNIKFVWQNGKFDISRLEFLHQLHARVDEDTMLMHYVGINERVGTHSLKDLGSLYLQAPKWDDELKEYKKRWCTQHKIKLGDFTYDMIPVDILIPYLHKDCIATFRLYKLFTSIMRENSKFIYRKLIEASNVYKDLEIIGFKVDKPYIQELDRTIKKQVEDAQNTLKTAATLLWNPLNYMWETQAKSAPDTFNHKSPKQLKWLFARMGIKVDSTNAETLNQVHTALKQKVTNPCNVTLESQALEFTCAIQELRKLNKQYDTYIVGIQKQMDPNGRIHSTYNLHGTTTGRLSSSDPNLHNIPRDKKIKNLFIPEEGRVLIQLDYSQAELRVLAYLSNDVWLTQIYLDDKDLHDAVALEMFGINFTKEQRVQAKNINFGIAYGRGPANLAEVFGISFSEAKNMISRWFDPMPEVKEFLYNRKKMPFRGEICGTPLGRERHFIITDDNKIGIENESMNFPIQSLASDLTVFSLIEISAELKKLEKSMGEYVGRIVNTVHDSIVIEANPKYADTIITFGKQIMANVPTKYLPNCSVPFKADAELGYSWGALEKSDVL